MNTQTEPLASPPMQSPQGKWLTAVLLFVLGFLVLLFASLQYYWPGKWMNPTALGWGGDALKLAEGRGNRAQGRLTVDGLSAQGKALVSLTTQAFRAEDYPVIKWSISSLNAKPRAKIEFVWQTAESPGGIFVRELAWMGNSASPLHMADDPNWRGQIIGLGLMVQAPLDAPLAIEAVKLEAFSPLGAVWREWFGAEPWLGTSINFVGGEIDRQRFEPLPFVAAALGLAMLGYGLLVWRKILAPDTLVLWALIFIAWFALDMRWQVDLWQKLGLTQQRYAGKSWEEKHLAGLDGQVFELIQQARAMLPPTPSRIFLYADEKYTLGRGVYHLYPHNVLGRALLDGTPTDFKSGDFIIILGQSKAVFDPAQHLLSWGAGQHLGADMLLIKNNILLLKVQ